MAVVPGMSMDEFDSEKSERSEREGRRGRDSVKHRSSELNLPTPHAGTSHCCSTRQLLPRHQSLWLSGLTGCSLGRGAGGRCR